MSYVHLGIQFLVKFFTHVAIVSSLTFVVSTSWSGATSQGGANYVKTKDGPELYDIYMMRGTVPIKLQKEALWKPLNEMFDYLDKEIPIFPRNSNYYTNDSNSFSYDWGLYFGGTIKEIFETSKHQLFYRNLKKKNKKITHQNIMNEILFPGLGSQLKLSLKTRKWYTEEKPLSTLGCINHSLTQDIEKEIGACQDDTEVRISSQLWKETKDNPVFQAELILHELFRIFFKPIVLLRVPGASTDESKQVLSDYGQDFLDKLVTKLVNLTSNRQGGKDMLEYIKIKLKRSPFYMLAKGADFVKEMYSQQNEAICSKRTSSDDELLKHIEDINEPLISKLNEELKGFGLQISGSYFSILNLTGRAEDILSFGKKHGFNNIFSFSNGDHTKQNGMSENNLISIMFMSQNALKTGEIKIVTEIPIAQLWTPLFIKPINANGDSYKVNGENTNTPEPLYKTVNTLCDGLKDDNILRLN